MTKIAKRILLVFCSFVFVLCCGIVGVLGLNTNKTIEAKAASDPTVTFQGIYASQNNVAWEGSGGFHATYLVFDEDFTEFGALNCPNGIYYTLPADNHATHYSFQLAWVHAAGTDGTGANTAANIIKLIYNGDAITHLAQYGAILHIDEGTAFAGQTLPKLELALDANAHWNAPLVGAATFTGFGASNNSAQTQFGENFPTLSLQFKEKFIASSDSPTAGSIQYTVPGGTPTDFDFVIAGNCVGWGCPDNQLDLTISGSPFVDGTVLNIVDGTVVGGVTLPGMTFTVVGGVWKEASTFKEIGAVNNGFWNKNPSFNGLYLKFSEDFAADTMADVSALKNSFYYTKPSENHTEKHSPGFIWANNNDSAANEITVMNSITNGSDPKGFYEVGSIMHIVGGTVVGGVVLPDVTLKVNAEGLWEYIGVLEEPLTFEGIGNLNNKNHPNFSQFPTVSVKFNEAFTAGSVDTVSDGSYNDKIYYTTSGTKGTFRYIGIGTVWGEPANELQLMLESEVVFQEGSTITIEEGTRIGERVLPGVTLYYNTNTGLWQDTAPAPKAEYVGIFSSNMSGTVWEAHSLLQIEFDRALAPNITDIQGAEKNANNSGNLSSQLTLGGEHVTMGSQINFYLNCFAYATTEGGNANSAVLEILFIGKKAADFAHATKLHIPDGTLFGEVQLAEVILYFNAETNVWQTEKPAPIVNGFTAVEGGSIRIDRENGGLRFETHLEKATYDSLVATYGKDNLKIGTYILPEAWLNLSGKSLYDYVTTYTAGGGYYMDISTWNTDKGDFGFANSDKDGNITDVNTYYKYYGTISKVKYENYLENFIGVGYIRVTDSEGEEYLYLTHDGSWSRNVYEIAKEAYKDTVKVSDNQLYGVTPYFDKVIEIRTSDNVENTLIYDIDSVLAVRPSYSYTKPTDYTVTVADGVITIVSTSNAVYNVLINGEKAGVIEANGTAYADYYALNAELFATAEEAKALNFGFGEPTQELWGTLAVEGFEKKFGEVKLNTGSTATNIAKVNKEYNGNTARIWFQIADVCWPNTLEEFAFLDGSINAIQGVVNDFRTQGVTNIALMSGVANYRSTKNYYNANTKTWYTFWDALGGQTATPYPNLIVLPGEDDYQDFLALQKEYFKQIALNVKGITTIEILNELETSMLNQTRFGIANGYAPDIDLVAQAAMDICKAATDGVKEAGKNIKIMMPALCCVNEMKNGENVTRYDSVQLLNAEYAYIMGENGTKNADDYFQIINIHPYVSISSDTSDVNYLYYEKDGLTLQTPTQIKERWVGYMDSLRAIFVKNGDAEKPVWITEFGIADYESCNDEALSSNKFSDYIKNKVLRQAQVFQIVYDAIMEMPYIDSVLFFRVGDYTCPQNGGENGKSHDYAVCGEATYGMIDENGAVKDIGKYMYAIVNGVNVFTDNSYETLKALDSITMPDGKQSITDFESAVEGFIKGR